jgi:thiosulfate/3-mercaptopyruvate sulfurtransferase
MNADATGALVANSELAALLEAGSRHVLLDVRWQVGQPALRSEYLSGHIPGAQFCDLDADLADPPGSGGRHPLPDPQRLQRRLREWGVSPDSALIVYDGAASVAAARAWWVLRWAGLTNVRVLDGGFAAWTQADGPLQTTVEVPEPGTVTVHPGTLPVLDAAGAGQWASEGRLIDVRAPERYRGDVEPMDPVAGRIPGALNLPTTDNVTSEGTFKPIATLRRQFAEAAANAHRPVGVYCGSGVTAAHTMLALEVAGIDAVLYPGSWSEWIADPNRPIATG